MIDIVYILGTGSTWENNEIRYSLRSVEKHLQNYRDVYIIGECPEWLQNVIHIPAEDKWHPSRNIMEKLLVACDFVGITERFMAMNDDLFFLEDVKATTYQYYYSGELIDSIDRFSKNWYNEYLALTMKALQRNECNTDNYDIHVPIIYDKELFPLIMEMYRWEEKLLVKSIYCNTINLPGIEISDCKIKGWKSEAQVKAMIKGRHIFSIGDYCLRDMPRRSPVKQLLETLYPNKSKYEK